MQISFKDLNNFLDIVTKRSGLMLSHEKRKNITTRLEKLLTRTNYTSFSEFLYVFETGNMNKIEIREVFNFVTTQETYFFRLPRQYEYLFEKVLPNFVGQNRKRLKILSAGCATGEEAYSLAMIFEVWNRKYPDKFLEYDITAVDISEKALKIAEKRDYSETSLKRVKSDPFTWQILSSFLFQKSTYPYSIFHMDDALGKNIRFLFMNLLQGERFFLSSYYDLIFFRNVLIYMQDFARCAICESIYRTMSMDSYLFLGETETPANENQFEMYFENDTYFFKKEFR
ncbi:CheR family methyltransferase [Candidatus Riflebacteria bacterium]